MKFVLEEGKRCQIKQQLATTPSAGDGDIQKLKIGGGFTKRSQFLRACAAVMEADCEVVNWKNVEDELSHVLKLRGTLTVMAISDNKALVEFANSVDRDELLDAEEVYLSFCNIKGRRWSPRVGTNCPELLKFHDRWIYMVGIPLHLWSSDVFALICSNLGR